MIKHEAHAYSSVESVQPFTLLKLCHCFYNDSCVWTVTGKVDDLGETQIVLMEVEVVVVGKDALAPVVKVVSILSLKGF